MLVSLPMAWRVLLALCVGGSGLVADGAEVGRGVPDGSVSPHAVTDSPGTRKGPNTIVSLMLLGRPVGVVPVQLAAADAAAAAVAWKACWRGRVAELTGGWERVCGRDMRVADLMVEGMMVEDPAPESKLRFVKEVLPREPAEDLPTCVHESKQGCDARRLQLFAVFVWLHCIESHELD